jgi:glycosyltransferase involved in cell wall biosynthesis
MTADKINILIISHLYPSTFNQKTFFVHNQIKELVRQGCSIKVVCPIPWVPPLSHFFSSKWKEYAKIPQRAIFDGIEVYYPRYFVLPRSFLFEFSGESMYLCIAKKIANIHKNFSFDIIHSHVLIPDGYAGMLLAKKYKKPLITTVHGLDFQYTLFKNGKFKKKIEDVVNYSEKTFVVSNKLKKIAEDNLGVSANKIEVLSNGIDEKLLENISCELFAKNQKKGKLILSISNLIKTKGVDFNILSFFKLSEKNKDISYLIIGDGPERKKLEVLVRKLNLADRIHFLGELPHWEAMEQLARCDIFCLPSWQEGFGVVYLEAMAFGKPVIACRGEGIDGVIVDGENGFLAKPRDIDDLTKKLDYLILNPMKALLVGKNGRRLIVEKYTWNKIVGRMIEVYREVGKKIRGGKVCIITTVHPAFDTRIFHKEAKSLYLAGYDVTLIARSVKNQTIDGIRIIALPTFKSRFLRIFFSGFKAFTLALDQKADIYHFHDPEFLLWAFLLKKKRMVRVIYDIHENILEDIYYKEWIPRLLRGVASRSYNFLIKKILPKLDCLILAEDSYVKFYSHRNVAVIKNYPLLKKIFEKSDVSGSNIANLCSLVYVGSVTGRRGIFEMIEAVRLLKGKFFDLKLEIIGGANETVAKQIKQKITELNLEKNIVYSGAMSHGEAMKRIANSGIGLALLHPIPNYYESFPTKMFEYMVAGIPVIVSKFPLLNKIIDKEKCGLCVDPNDPKAIAAAVTYLIEHPVEAKRMGNNGKKAAIEIYNWGAEEKKLLAIYKDFYIDK